MNPWHDFEMRRVTPERFVAVVEISKGGKNKYELDKPTGMLKLDRVLYTSTHYPANYGLIPLTLADDNDPLDVLIMCQETIAPMCIVECKPLGVMTMIDDDEKDEKIIAVPVGDPSMEHYTDISQLPDHNFQEMRHFFEVYKALEGKNTFVERMEGHYTAEKVIETCMEAYQKQFFTHE